MDCRSWFIAVVAIALVFGRGDLLFGQEECAAVTRLKVVATQEIQDNPISRSAHEFRVLEEEDRTGLVLKELYSRDRLNFDRLNKCVRDYPHAERLKDSMMRGFFLGTYARLRTVDAAVFKRLLKLTDPITANGREFPFRLTGHLFGPAPVNDLPAGFQRVTGSIFMDLEKVPASEWQLIFIHEMSHAADNILRASAVFAAENSALEDRLIEMAKKQKTVTEWQKSDVETLRNWIWKALERGLLAEYRAWLVTHEIYATGIEEGLWDIIPWMEKAYVGAMSSEHFDRQLFLFLDKGFYDPQDGLYEYPVPRAILKELREDLRQGRRQIDLGNLGTVQNDR